MKRFTLPPSRLQAQAFADVVAMPCFMVSHHGDGQYVMDHLNAAHVDAVGIAVEAVRGKPLRECYPARVAAVMEQNYEICRKSGKSFAYEEFLGIAGQERWWYTTLSPVLDEATGELAGIIGLSIDITEQKAREFRRAETESALRKLNEEIALFTSMTAHDVRGPLNQIESLSELTLDGFTDMGDNKRDMIVNVKKIAAGSLKHIDGILDHAAALRFGMMQTEVVDLGHICRDIAAVVDPEARFEITSPDLFIDAEPAVVQTILRNLTENATRHACSCVSIAASEGGPGRLVFSVADDGPGFEGGAEAFAQKMKSRRVSPDNRGFGLSASANLVQSRGGAMRLDAPQFAQGTTICFDLPGHIAWEHEIEAQVAQSG